MLSQVDSLLNTSATIRGEADILSRYATANDIKRMKILVVESDKGVELLEKMWHVFDYNFQWVENDTNDHINFQWIDPHELAEESQWNGLKSAVNVYGINRRLGILKVV